VLIALLGLLDDLLRFSATSAVETARLNLERSIPN